MNGIKKGANPTPPEMTVATDEVHIWSIPLALTDSQIRKLALYLATDEVERWQRFYFERDRNRFVIARGSLRLILSAYIGRQPYEIQFDYNKYGKPFLNYNSGGDKIRFNLSHSHELALVGVTGLHDIGIDVEYMQTRVADLSIAERFFSPKEVAILRKLPVALQRQAFFNCWTRKEAYIKAQGQGLSLALDSFDVAFVPDQPAALLHTRPDAREAAQWSIYNLPQSADYAAAVAVKGKNHRLKFFTWSPN
ncbi:MAG: 4'-phosphopantetheinyl transferase superfamily protein [candidate division KSB1 bacterium]|nr:4'-phosphopantetheinyl transferase superfamily protein [candidate division KSB1 bacterium]